MRRFVPVFAFLFLAPTACRHDLTLCHDENDGPACRDSALDQLSESEGDGADIDTDIKDSQIIDTESTTDTTVDSASIDSTGEDSLEVGLSDTTIDGTLAETAADTSVLDTATIDTASFDTYVMDSYLADTHVADTHVADTYVADTYVPDTHLADTGPFDTGPSCTAGSYSCGGTGGNTLYRCADAGLSAVVTCPSGTCNASLGRCTACTPGAYSCSGATRVVCDSLGATTSTVATCATPELCGASTGATCMSPVCSSTDISCTPPSDPPAVRACNAGRTGYADTSCAVGCRSASCLKVSSIAGGQAVMCAIMSDTTVWCWDGTYTPHELAGLTGATQIAVRGWSGARLADGTVRLWVGAGAGAAAPFAPGWTTPVAGIAGADMLSIGDTHACARLTGGTVKCWGQHSFGAMGSTSTSTYAPPTFYSPSLVATGGIACGFEASYALLSDGVRSWGLNDMGQLGIGSFANTTSPTLSFSAAAWVAPGGQHTCALTSSGNVLCAGANGVGQLGDGSSGAPRTTPAMVLGIDGQVAQLVSGHQHSCALLKDGTVRCWGSNGGGALGDGTLVDRYYPTAVPGLNNVKQIAATDDGVCALLNDQTTLKCWGQGTVFGPGGTNSPTPTSLKWW